MRRAGMMPASMFCCNSPKAGSLLKPEVSFKTKKNTENQAWVVFAYFGDLDWKPGGVGQKQM
ncbi:hypothetical protein SAMN04515647_3638 [Cohaesibacter sp. ES.047]|nr:hypothetical protein SAMN04515647_3638 [Cohaesibacter sp. ES.047]